MRSLAGTIAKSPSEVAKHRGFVCGIMGLPYHGKTSLAKTLVPEHSPVCLFDVAGGTHVLEDMPEQIQIYVPNDWNHLNSMLTDLENDPKPFKSIWTDVVTMVQEDSVDHHNVHLAGINDARQRQIRFGESNWDIVQYHRRLLTLAEKHGVNVFFIYWASRPVEIEGGENRLRTRHIVLSPTVALKVEGMLDIVAYVEKAPHPTPYPPTIRLDGDPSIAAKVRLEQSNPLKKWKDVVQGNSTILSDMVNAFHGTIDERYMK